MNLTEAVDHADAYTWSAVLLAHAFLGLALTAAVAAAIDALDRDDMVTGRAYLAAVVVTAAYAIGWETLVQGLAAGFFDAATDTLATAAGAFTGALAWQRRGGKLAAVWLALIAWWAYGIRGRK